MFRNKVLSIFVMWRLVFCFAIFIAGCRVGLPVSEVSFVDDSSIEDVGMIGGGVDLLTIELPFFTGYEATCPQGANGGYSHTSSSTRYDVDFDTPNDKRDPVFAPVGGVAYTHTESRTRNYGEHINIDQGDGTYVILAHLDDIFVDNGEEVAAGQLLGFEGHTGMASGDHVHIGRHSGSALLKGEYGTSLNALAFNAIDESIGASVTKMTTELSCDISTGHTYQSTLPTPQWHPSGSLLKLPDSSTVYLLDGFTMRPFLNEGAFTSWKYDWDDIVLISSDETSCFAMGDAVRTDGMVTAVYDSSSIGAWLLVGSPTDPNRYRQNIISAGATTVLATWGISATSLSSLPSSSSVGLSLSNYPALMELATFRDGSLVSTVEYSDVYVMEGGAAIPVANWDTFLLMGFANRTVYELSERDFDDLVDIVGNCETDSYCIANNDVTTCGGDTEDVPGTYPGEGVGGVESEEWVPGAVSGVGLEIWWHLEQEADWITISGEFTNENNYGYGWTQNITWSTWSDELYFSIADMGSRDSFRYSYAFAVDAVENWSCLGPFPPGELTGTPFARYNGTEIDVSVVEDPGSDGCGLQVSIP